MRISKTIIALLIIGVSACGQTKQPKYIPDPKARLLYDSAMKVWAQTQDYENSILLLNRAIDIDSNYSLAYSMKVGFECDLKNYDQALITAKKLNSLRPGKPEYLFMTGFISEKTNDTINSIKYFEKSLEVYNKILDTMPANTEGYFSVELNKAIDLILLKKEKDANAILQSLSTIQTDESHKEILELFMNKSRQQIIDYISDANENSSSVQLQQF